MAKPLCIDLFSGRFGWGRAFVQEGWQVVGFDIEHLPHHGPVPDGCELVLQDVLTLHGSQFRNAACIVASPPCQEYSYMAMPWKRAKQIAQALRGNGEFPEDYTGSRTTEQLNALFNACFRIQREASKEAGRHIPLVVENVKGAQPWVGRARANFGSYYLWGDVESVGGRIVAGGLRFGQTLRAARRSIANPGLANGTFPGGGLAQGYLNNEAGVKVPGENGRRTDVGKGARFTSRDCGVEGQKGSAAAWFNDYKNNGTPIEPNARLSYSSSRSSARKAASAQIAEIPFALASYIARSLKPQTPTLR